MSWETPKTNWTADDYYNLEDARRIAGNICHLYDMALRIYGRTAITCLIRRETHFISGTGTWVQFFGIYSIGNWYNRIPVSPSDYTRDLTYWLDKDTINLLILTNLKAMSVKPAPIRVSNYWVDYNINHQTNTASYFFSGICIPDDENYVSHYYGEPPVISIWGSWDSPIYNTGYAYLPLLSNWTPNSSGTSCMVSITGSEFQLQNKKFYTYTTLNKIEKITKAVYDKFTSYLGG